MGLIGLIMAIALLPLMLRHLNENLEEQRYRDLHPPKREERVVRTADRRRAERPHDASPPRTEDRRKPTRYRVNQYGELVEVDSNA